MSMKYALPDEYDLVCRKTDAESEINKKLVQKFCEGIKSVMSANYVEEFEVSGRVKSVYSIYRKHIDREVPYEEIYDIVGCRIICREELDCYRILGILHKTWRPMGDKIKDYIASPKLNGYRSLHTTLIDNETGNQVEVQIRTYVMDLEAEYGFASHIDYKDKGKRVEWLDEFPLWEKEFTDSSEFLSLLKSNISATEITVYTKKGGEAVKLPDGAVVLDLAYSLGEDKGSKCSGAIIDGKLEPIDRKLFKNETVDLLTSTDSKPNLEWLSIAKTPKAKTAIKKHLRQTEIDEKTNQAFNLLINAYDYLKYPISFNEYKKDILKFFGLHEEKALYDKIYSGAVTTDDILSFTMTMTKEISDFGKMPQFIRSKRTQHMLFINSLKNSNTIRTAICCNPVPGDKIIGFRTNGDRGISIHREDCPNALLFADDVDRVIYCDWTVGGDLGMFSEEITILGIDRENILLDIVKVFADRNVKYSYLDFYKGNGVAKILVKIEIKNVRELFNLLTEIKRKKGVSSVHRNLVPRKIA
jgi:GTP pyrophosphokinase